MSPENLLNDAIKSIKNGTETISNKYEEHIREKAMEQVNAKIIEKGLDIEQIEQDDYEAMVSDLSKDIKEDYAKKTAQGLLGYISISIIFGF